jgi:membrane-bound lytic murein transglycosylase MltF
MLSSGQIDVSVVEAHMGSALAPTLPGLVVREDLVLRDGGSIAWAVRRASPKLREALDGFLSSEYREGSIARNLLAKRYREMPSAEREDTREVRRFESTVELFRKYGSRYGFHPMMLMAQAFQESRIDQSRRSPRGAIGIMQLMPSTARALAVGDIRKADANVHAGARYLRLLIDEYFGDPGLSDLDRVLFAWAAYNAGPGRIAALRQEAARAGRDPDVWFGQVERVAARRIGPETVQYVSSVYWNYVAYRMEAEASAARAAAREQTRQALRERPDDAREPWSSLSQAESQGADRCAPLALVSPC